MAVCQLAGLDCLGFTGTHMAMQVSAKVNAKVPKDPHRILKVGMQGIMAVCCTVQLVQHCKDKA